MGIALRFVGQPGQFVAGVPAGDLEVETQAEADELIAGGLYELAEDAGSPVEADAPVEPAEQEA